MPKLEFLNVDLDLLFAKEPKTLLRELRRKIIVLHAEQQSKNWSGRLELNRDPKDLEKTLRHWIKVLKSLSPKARSEFLRADSRTFNLGFDVVHDDSHLVQIELPADLLADLARWKANHISTLYREDEDSNEPERGRLVRANLR